MKAIIVGSIPARRYSVISPPCLKNMWRRVGPSNIQDAECWRKSGCKGSWHLVLEKKHFWNVFTLLKYQKYAYNLGNPYNIIFPCPWRFKFISMYHDREVNCSITHARNTSRWQTKGLSSCKLTSSLPSYKLYVKQILFNIWSLKDMNEDHVVHSRGKVLLSINKLSFQCKNR